MTPEEKKIKIANLRLKHQGILNATDVFIPKMAYYHKPIDEKIISFFDSEMRNEKDIYVEFVDREYNHEDPQRRLYKWKFNPHFKEELEKIENPEKGYHTWTVPVAELILIENKEVALPNEISKDQFTEEKKILEEKLGYPDFMTQLRDSYALSAIIGLLPYAGAFTNNSHDAHIAKRAFEIADALILERSKKVKPKIKTT